MTDGREAILVVDVGNTSTSAGLALGRRVLRTGRTPTHGSAVDARARRLLRRLARGQAVMGAVLCSVVPAANAAWTRALRGVCRGRIVTVSHRVRLGVRIDYPKPATIGADRLANACAAWERYRRAVIVADFGTALTFDIVSGQGAYVGGVIAPGLPLMTDYLAERTALLPSVRLSGPHGRIGRNTREAMRIGALVGYRGMVREILNHVRQDLRERNAVFCATGGYAAQALDGLGIPVAIDPLLTLNGLALIYEFNRARK